jgi:hypothetical protein
VASGTWQPVAGNRPKAWCSAAKPHERPSRIPRRNQLGDSRASPRGARSSIMGPRSSRWQRTKQELMAPLPQISAARPRASIDVQSSLKIGISHFGTYRWTNLESHLTSPTTRRHGNPNCRPNVHRGDHTRLNVRCASLLDRQNLSTGSYAAECRA